MTRTYVSFDAETHCIQEGLLAPPLVCGSVSSVTVSDDGAIVKSPGELLLKRGAIERAWEILTSSATMVGANLAFDFGVLANERPELLRTIFDALAAGRVHDVLVCQALDAIGRGFLTDPLTDPHDGGILRNEYGKPAKRHSLWICTYILQDRTDAKLNDFWRERYALLEGVPVEDWPVEARQYPIDDVDNALENALRQLGLRGEEWMACNLSDLAAQVETAFCLHLGAIRGIRVCSERLAALKEPLEKWHEEYVAKFQAKGLLQPAALANGSRNPDAGKKSLAAVRRAVAEAYGAEGTCAACGGKGRRRTVKFEECRGFKEKNRYQGCKGEKCLACMGTGKKQKNGNEVTCTDCQGTALDLSTSSVIPYTDKDGISTDRDTLMESGDDDLSEFAENQASKIRETYVPFLELGVNGPLTLSPNVLVASGRTSYAGLIQLIPRKGFDVKDERGQVVKQYGVRDCFKARDGYYFCSVDYSALELCTLAQVCLWVCGYSEMARVINESGKPGKLHIAFAAKMANVPVEEMEARYKAGDKLAQAFRQASKPCFHPDTEILTRGRGWVKVSELTMQDEVASATPERAGGVRIEWAHPMQLTRRRAPDGLIHFQSSRLNLRVTPNHRMLVLNGYNEFATVEASDVRATHGWHNAGRCRQGGRRAHVQLLREAVAIQFQGENTQGKAVKDICVAAGVLNEDGTIPWWWLDLDHDLRWVVCDELGWHTRTCGATCSRVSADVFQALLSITNRKAFIVSPALADPERAPDRVSLNVSQQDCTSSYDYMLDIDEFAYDGDVYCLSVPSSYVLVRDKGVPVIVGQCNFGLGGGMGALTFVLTNRLENAGDTTAPNGRKYAGIRFCILIDGAQECGTKKVTQWGRPGRERPCPPTCERCLEIVEYQLRPAWFEQWPEVEEYHTWVKRELDRTGGMVPCFGPWAAEGLHDWERRAHRVRGGIDRVSASFNNGFQALASDGGKLALRRVTRECYLDETSPLYGTRPIMFVHDEIFSEVPIERAHEAAHRKSEIMKKAMREWTPDVISVADPALMKHWLKGAEPVYRDGKLIPWEDK